MTGTPGRFVWYDLMTTDLDTAAGFYTKLFGWTLKDVDMGSFGTYSMIHVGDTGIGGMVRLDPSHGMPSHWMAYATVADVDAAARRAEELGGQVGVQPTDIPYTGRFAVIADPQGAWVSPFAFAGDAPPEADGPPPAGHVCWNELLTTDPKGALAFHKEIFGWDHKTWDMGPAGTYYLFTRDGKDAAGMMEMPEDAEAPPQWMSYFLVADVDATVAKARELGATVYVPPRDIPDVGRMAVLADPTGASFGIFRGK